MSSNLAYQYEYRDELIGGKIVLMSPRPAVKHNFVSGNIYRIFSNYLDGKRCTPFADGTDLYLTEEDRFVPDGMIVCDPGKIREDGVYGAPDLVVEVLSPSTARYDRSRKKDVYEVCGVREYWIVSPNEKTLEQYLLLDGKFTLRHVYALYPDWMAAQLTDAERAAYQTAFQCSLFDDLTIHLEAVFARVN